PGDLADRLDEPGIGPGPGPQLLQRPALYVARGSARQPVEGPVGADDAEVGVEDRKGLPDRIDDGVGTVPGMLDLIGRPLDLVDVDDRNHGAVDLVLDGDVGPDSHRVPPALAVAHVVILGDERPDHLRDAAVELRELKFRANVADWPADVAGDQVEQLLG